MEANSDSSPPNSLSSLFEPPIGSSNGTPHSTPVNGCSAEDLMIADPPTESTLRAFTQSKFEKVKNVKISVETGTSPPLAVQPASPNEALVSNPKESSSFLKGSGQLTNNVTVETSGTNSSSESCKTPMASSNDVIITMEDDDDDCKSPLLTSENECSSAEVIYVRKEPTMETTAGYDDVKDRSGNGDLKRMFNKRKRFGECDDMAMKFLTCENKLFIIV